MENLNFEKSNGLIPVIIQDEISQEVLMLGFMNKEAYLKTEREKRVTFYSRSKKRLWTKGETSGNFLNVKKIFADCDSDCLLIWVNPDGSVCHTGSQSCFDTGTVNSFLYQLERTIHQRINDNTAESYTNQLFKKGINKVVQKVGEEAVELIIEAKDTNDELFKNEAADLLFHYLILLKSKGFSLKDIEEVLKRRSNRVGGK